MQAPSLELAGSFQKLAQVYRKWGDINASTQCFTKSLDLKIRSLGAAAKANTDIAISYHDAALVLLDNGDLDGAENFLAKALSI